MQCFQWVWFSHTSGCIYVSVRQGTTITHISPLCNGSVSVHRSRCRSQSWSQWGKTRQSGQISCTLCSLPVPLLVAWDDQTNLASCFPQCAGTPVHKEELNIYILIYFPYKKLNVFSLFHRLFLKNKTELKIFGRHHESNPGLLRVRL